MRRRSTTNSGRCSRKYYQPILAAFQSKDGGLCRPDARALLAAAPTPAAAKLTDTDLRAILRTAGRRRGIDAEADRLAIILGQDGWLRQPTLVEQAMGQRALALLRQLDAACAGEQDLARAVEEAFQRHPDGEILTSFPGVGNLTGARILGEVGDDRARFADARALKAYAGSAPVTRASGRSLTVTTRRVKNQRLAAAGYVWACSALAHDPGARAHYDRRRTAGDRHVAAQRHLFNRMIGMLHHCLTKRVAYDAATAFPIADNTTGQEGTKQITAARASRR